MQNIGLSLTYIHTQRLKQMFSLSMSFTLCLPPLFLSGNVNISGLTMRRLCPYEPLCEICCSYRSVEAEFISNASLVVVRRWTNKRLAGEAYLSGCKHTHTSLIQKDKYVYTHTKPTWACMWAQIATHPLTHAIHISEGTLINWGIKNRSLWSCWSVNK